MMTSTRYTTHDGETFTLSDQQDTIVRTFADDGSGHIVVSARAGCSKTFMIVAGVEAAPEASILVCAFSKAIELVLKAKVAHLGSKVTAKTFHALGLSLVKRFWPDVKVSFGPERAQHLTEKVCGAVAPDAIKKLVTKLHTQGRLMAPHAKTVGDLTDIAYRFECDPEEGWANDGFDLTYIETKALAAMELAATVKPVLTGIDGADMIFLPVRNRWMRPMFDMVVVDEGQDMNVAQLELGEGVCRGRFVIVGDPFQAIFGFCGADSGSLGRLKTKLNATELPLTTTYRCGRSIVELAATLVPDFAAGPDNPEGEVIELGADKLTETAGPGDFILSRVNAPLVSIAMSLLRSGKRTRIAGRDIGKGLVTLVRKLKARSVPDLLDRIRVWEDREIKRLTARLLNKGNGDLTQNSTAMARLDGIRDQAEMLTAMTDGAKNVDEVTDRIEALFTDDGLGEAGMITCSSVHRSKGLEAKRVFVMTDTLRLTSDEERNIAYVAYTRAKTTLFLVGGKR